MKTMRETYFENFRKIQTPAGNRRGFRTTYRYTGKWISWDLEENARRKTMAFFTLAELTSIAVYLSAAMIRTPFNSQRISSGLFILSMIPWIAEIWGVIRLVSTKKPMMESDFDEIRNCITIGGSVRMVLLLCGAATGSVMMVTMQKLTVYGAAAALGHLISGGVSFIIFKRYTSLPYEFS